MSEITRRSSSRIVAQQQAKALKNTQPTSTSTSSAQGTSSVNSAAKAAVNAEEIQKLTEKYNKESHQRRLEFLKRQIFAARKDNWLYPPIDSILSG